MVEEITEREYGLLISISSETDLGSELLKKGNEPVSFSSIEEAMRVAKTDSEEPRLIRDWVYMVVPLHGRTWGMPVATYHALPLPERIASRINV